MFDNVVDAVVNNVVVDNVVVSTAGEQYDVY